MALAVADVVVYSSLSSYLYNQADSTLQISHMSVEQAADEPDQPNTPNPRSSGSSDNAPGASNFCAIGRLGAPDMFIQVRSAAGKVVSGERCPAYVPGGKSYSPQLPAVISGYRLTSVDPNGTSR